MLSQRRDGARCAAIMGGALSLASTVLAAPPAKDYQASTLEKRTPILSDSDSVTADGKVPLDAIILIGVALAFALFCMCLSLWNIKYPGSSNGRIVIEERARARTELRLRGGGSRRGSDMATLISSPNGSEGKAHRGNGSRASSQTLDSRTHLFIGGQQGGNDLLFQKPASHVRPKLANDKISSASRASRGYSVYSTKDLPRRPMAQASNSAVLNVPTLSRAESDSQSSGSHPSSSVERDLEAASPPPHARPRMTSRPTNGSTLSRMSMSIGAGTDLSRHRSIGRDHSNNNLAVQARRSLRQPVGPRPIDASYGQTGRLSPTKGAELHRSTATPDSRPDSLAPQDLRLSQYSSGSSQGRAPAARSGSSPGADYSSAGHRASPGYFDGSASEEGGYRTPPVHHPLLPRSPAQGGGGSRPLAYYENSEETEVSAAHHFTKLLESPHSRQYGRRG